MAATNEIINLLLNVRTEVTDTQSFKAFAATFKANLTDLEKQAKEAGAGIEAAFNHIDALLKKPGVTKVSFLKGLDSGTEAEKFNTIVQVLIGSKDALAQSFEKSINVSAFLESLNKLSDLRTVLNIDFGKTPKAKIDEAFSVLSAALKSNIESFANEQIGFDQLFEKLFSAGPKTNIAKGITSTFNLIKEDIQKGIVDVNNLTTDDRLNIIQKLEAKLNQGLTKSTVLHTYTADLEYTTNHILAILNVFYTRGVIPPQDFFKEFRTGLRASGALAKTELEKILKELTAINPQLAGDQKFLTNLLNNLGFKPADINSFFKTAESTLIKQLESLNKKLQDAGTLNTAGFVSDGLVKVRERLNELTSQEKLKTLIDPTVAEALKVANAELNLFGTSATKTFAEVSNFEKGLKQLIGSIDTSTAFGAAFKPLLESYLNFEGKFRLGQAFQSAGDLAVNTISGIEKRLVDLGSNGLKLNLQKIQEGTFKNGDSDVSTNAFKLKEEAAIKYQSVLYSLTNTIKTVEERLLVLNSIDPKSISDAQATQRNALISDYGKILEQLNTQLTENKASFDGWNATWKKASESSDFATNAVNQFYKSLDSGKTAGYIASTLEVGAGFLKFAQDAGQASSAIDGVFANFLRLDGNTKATIETLQRAKTAIVDLFADQGRIGAAFPLASFGSGFDVPASLKTKIIELADGGKAANEQYTKLIELANTLNTIQSGGTSFGKQVTALADLARGAQDFKDSLKLAQVSGETASTAVNSLNTNYEHLLSLVDKYNKVKDSKEPTGIKAAEDALKAIEVQYRKVTRAVDTTTERVEFLKTAQSLLKGNVNFASDASLASLSYFDIELNRTSAAIVKLADDIKLLKGLEPSINFDAMTSGAKNARKTLEDVFEGLRTTLAGKLNGILDGIKIEGLPQSFGNDLRTQFDNILASLKSGDFSTALTQINGLFKALEETFKNQTATVSGAEAVEKLVTPWRALAGELGTSLDNAVKVIAEKVPQLNKTFANDANSKTITEEFAVIKTAAEDAKKSIGSFNETVSNTGKQNLLAGLESALANLQTKLTALKDTGITPTDFATFQSDLKILNSEITKNKDLLKSVSEVKFNTLLADTKQLSDNFKQASTLNSGGLTNTLDVLDARFNSLRGTIASTGNVLQEVFNKGYGGEQLIKFDSKTLEGLGAKIREALSAATKGSAEESALIALEARWKSLTEAAGQYNAVQSFAKSGNLAANAVHDTQALADLETRITGLTSSFAQYQRELQTAAQNTNLTATQAADLAKSFKIVQDGTQNTTAEIGILRNSASGLSSVLGKLKEAGGQNTDGYKWLDDIRLKINEIVKSKLALDDRFKNGFIGNIEADLNRLIQARIAIEQVANIGKNFGNQDYLNITASSAKNAVNEIQRLGTTLNKLKGDLEKSLAVPKLTQLDPVLETQLRSQLVQVELNAKALKEYQAVYEQLQSGLKIEAFEKLRNTITQATESAISSRQGVSDYAAAMRDAAQQAVLLATSLKDTQVPLQSSTIDTFKQQSASINTLRKDAEGYLNLLKALKDANVVSLPWGPVDASGKAATVTISGLITVFQNLLNVSTAASKPLSEAAQVLETRLGTAAGQAELRINSLSAKIQDLQTRINGITPGSGITEMYGSIRQMLTLLEKPLPQTPFFTLPKEGFAVIRNELSSALKIASDAAGKLATELAFLKQEKPLDSVSITQGVQALKEAEKTVTELTRGMHLLSEAEKQASKFSGIRENLLGVSTNLTELAHEGAFIYKGLDALFKNLAKNLAPKFQLDTSSFNSQLDAMTNKLGITGDAATHLKKQIQDVANTQLGGGGLAAATQYKAAFEELEKAFVKFHSGLSQAAMGFQMLGDSMLEPFKKAKENYEQFSDTMGAVNAVTNATASQFAALTSQALLMGATTRFTAEQAAEGLKELAKAGFTAEQQIAALPSVMRLAQAAGTELATATQIATVVMNEFRMDPEQFNQASDAIALAANSTLASVEDLGYAFKYVGALASNIGGDFNELTAAIAILHNSGMKGTMAGTALRGMLMNLYNPTKEDEKVIAELSERIGGLGLQIQDAEGNFLGFSAILKQLEQAGITSGEVLKLFGQRAGPGMAALLAQGSDALIELEGNLKNAEGTTAHMAEIMEETLKGKLLLMRSAFQALSDSIGHNLAGTLMTAADAMGDFVSRLVAVREEFPVLASVVDHVLGGFALLASVVGGLAVSFAFVLVPVRQFWGFLKTLVVTALAGAASITALSSSQAFNLKVTAATIAAAEAEFVARVAAARATQMEMNATNLNTIAKGINVIAIREQMVALHGAAAAAGLNAAAQGSMWVGLKNVFLGLGKNLLNIGGMMRWALTTPMGLAFTSVTSLVAYTLLHEKSVSQANEELKKQGELLTYSQKEALRLSAALVNTAEKIKSTQEQLNSLGKNNLTPDEQSQSAQLKVKLDFDKETLNKQLRDLYTRLSEDGSKLKDKVKFEVALDDKGTFTTFKVNIDGAAETINVFANGASGAAEQLKKLTPELDRVAEAEKRLLAQQQAGNILRKNFGQTAPENQTAFGKNVDVVITNIKKLIGLGPKVNAAVADLNKINDLLELAQKDSASLSLVYTQQNSNPFFIKSGSAAELDKFLSELKTKATKAKLLVTDLLESSTTTVLENLVTATGLKVEQLARLPNLSELIKEKTKLLFEKENIPFEYFDDVVLRLTKQFKDIENATTVTQITSEPFRKPFNEIVSALVNLEGVLEEKNKEFKKLIKEQGEIFKDVKPVVDALKKYEDAFVKFDKAKLDSKVKTLEFEVKINNDKAATELTQQIEQLTADSKVVDLPFAIKPDFITTDRSLLSGIQSVGGILLNYEKSINEELIALKLKQLNQEYEAVVNVEQGKQKAIRESLNNISTELKNKNADYYQIEQEKRTAWMESLKTEYDATVSHINKLYTLRAGLAQKSAQLDNDYTSRQATAASNLQKLLIGSKSDFQKQKFYKEQIIALKQLADEAASTGNLDKAKALLDQQQTLITQAIGEVAGEKGKGAQKAFLKEAQIANLETTGTVIDRLKADSEAAQALLTKQIEDNEKQVKRLVAETKDLGENLNKALEALQKTTYLDIGITKESYDRLVKFAEAYKEYIRELNQFQIDAGIRETDPEKINVAKEKTLKLNEEQIKNEEALKLLQQSRETIKPTLDTQGVANGFSDIITQATKLYQLLNNTPDGLDTEKQAEYEAGVKAIQDRIVGLNLALKDANLPEPFKEEIRALLAQFNQLNLGADLKIEIGDDKASKEAFVKRQTEVFKELEDHSKKTGETVGKQLNEGYLTAFKTVLPTLDDLLEKFKASGDVSGVRDIIKLYTEVKNQLVPIIESLEVLQKRGILKGTDLTELKEVLALLKGRENQNEKPSVFVNDAPVIKPVIEPVELIWTGYEPEANKVADYFSTVVTQRLKDTKVDAQVDFKADSTNIKSIIDQLKTLDSSSFDGGPISNWFGDTYDLTKVNDLVTAFNRVKKIVDSYNTTKPIKTVLPETDILKIYQLLTALLELNKIEIKPVISPKIDEKSDEKIDSLLKQEPIDLPVNPIDVPFTDPTNQVVKLTNEVNSEVDQNIKPVSLLFNPPKNVDPFLTKVSNSTQAVFTSLTANQNDWGISVGNTVLSASKLIDYFADKSRVIISSTFEQMAISVQISFRKVMVSILDVFAGITNGIADTFEGIATLLEKAGAVDTANQLRQTVQELRSHKQAYKENEEAIKALNEEQRKGAEQTQKDLDAIEQKYRSTNAAIKENGMQPISVVMSKEEADKQLALLGQFADLVDIQLRDVGKDQTEITLIPKVDTSTAKQNYDGLITTLEQSGFIKTALSIDVQESKQNAEKAQQAAQNAAKPIVFSTNLKELKTAIEILPKGFSLDVANIEELKSTLTELKDNDTFTLNVVDQSGTVKQVLEFFKQNGNLQYKINFVADSVTAEQRVKILQQAIVDLQKDQPQGFFKGQLPAEVAQSEAAIARLRQMIKEIKDQPIELNANSSELDRKLVETKEKLKVLLAEQQQGVFKGALPSGATANDAAIEQTRKELKALEDQANKIIKPKVDTTSLDQAKDAAMSVRQEFTDSDIGEPIVIKAETQQAIANVQELIRKRNEYRDTAMKSPNFDPSTYYNTLHAMQQEINKFTGNSDIAIAQFVKNYSMHFVRGNEIVVTSFKNIKSRGIDALRADYKNLKLDVVDIKVDDKGFQRQVERLQITGNNSLKDKPFVMENFQVKANTWDGIVSEGNRYMRNQELILQGKLDPASVNDVSSEVKIKPTFENPQQAFQEMQAKVKAENPITVAVNAQGMIGEIQSELAQLKASGATDIKVTVDKSSGQLVVTADTSQATREVDSIIANINSKSVVLSVTVSGQEKLSEVKNQAAELTNAPLTTTLQVMADSAISGINTVKNLMNSIPNNTEKTITVKYETQGTPPMQSRNKGGIIGSIQHFAEGGLAKFKELANSFVPGAGNTDTVPAMLTPGEFVIKKDRVQELGVGFLNALNSGLIQFKSMGGMIANAPMNTLNAMSSYTQPQYKLPQQEAQTAGGPSVNINLTIKDKKFNIKTPRDQVDGLVSAFKQLNRTL